MGFLSGLGKVLKVAAPMAASFIPGVGPVASKVLNRIGAAGGALSSVGAVAGGAAQGAQQGRQFDTSAALELQRIRQQQAEAAAADAFRRGAYQGDDTFRRAQFGHAQQEDVLKRPGLFGKQALAGGLMQGLQDVNISRPQGSTIPTFNVSGGLRPSAMGPEAREAGGAMARHALMQMLSGGPAPIQLGPQADLGPGYQAPAEPVLPKAGLGEKLLGGLGLGGSLLGAIGAGLTRQDPSAARTPPIVPDQPNPLIFSKRPYRGLFAPLGRLG